MDGIRIIMPTRLARELRERADDEARVQRLHTRASVVSALIGKRLERGQRCPNCRMPINGPVCDYCYHGYNERRSVENTASATQFTGRESGQRIASPDGAVELVSLEYLGGGSILNVR